MNFYFLQGANFFRKATNGRPCFSIGRFVRVRSAGFYVCGLSSGTLRGMTCNRCLAMGMNGDLSVGTGVPGTTHTRNRPNLMCASLLAKAEGQPMKYRPIYRFRGQRLKVSILGRGELEVCRGGLKLATHLNEDASIGLKEHYL